MKTYAFKIVVEPDGDRWHACCPLLERYGAATWGHTQEEAFRNMQELLPAVIQDLREDHVPIPEGPWGDVSRFATVIPQIPAGH